jgi:hypothetical protein
MRSSDHHWRPSSASRSACLVGRALLGLALFGLAPLGLAGCNTFSEVAAAPAVDQVAPTATMQNAGDIKYYPSDASRK